MLDHVSDRRSLLVIGPTQPQPPMIRSPVETHHPTLLSQPCNERRKILPVGARPHTKLPGGLVGRRHQHQTTVPAARSQTDHPSGGATKASLHVNTRRQTSVICISSNTKTSASSASSLPNDLRASRVDGGRLCCLLHSARASCNRRWTSNMNWWKWTRRFLYPTNPSKNKSQHRDFCPLPTWPWTYKALRDPRLSWFVDLVFDLIEDSIQRFGAGRAAPLPQFSFPPNSSRVDDALLLYDVFFGRRGPDRPRAAASASLASRSRARTRCNLPKCSSTATWAASRRNRPFVTSWP